MIIAKPSRSARYAPPPLYGAGVFLFFIIAGASAQPIDSSPADTAESRLSRPQAGFAAAPLIPGMMETIPLDQPLLNNPDLQSIPLRLMDGIHRALEHNLDIRIGGYEPSIRMTNIVEAEAAFDAVLFGSSQFDSIDKPNIDTGYYTRTTQTDNGAVSEKIPTDPFVDQHDYNYSLGLRKRLPTGATVQLAQLMRRFRDFHEENLYRNPYFESTLQLELRQPLLRDFGLDINRAGINAARNNFQISRQQFQRTVIQIAADVETIYWRLIFARQKIAIYENQLRQAEITLRRLLERKTLDASSVFVSRNRGLIERAKANLVASQNETLQLQDQLLQNLNDPNLPVDGKWEILTLDLPTTQITFLDRSQAIQIALKMRPELIAQKIQIDTSRLAVGVAENQLLPRLDLVAQQSDYGSDEGYRSSFDNQWDFDMISSRVGISFELPLGGNRAAQAALTRAKHQLQQDYLRLKSFEDQVTADVSSTLTRLESARTELPARHRAAVAEADTVLTYQAREDAEAAIDAGFLDRKIESLDRLASVQLQVIQTLLEYNVALMDVHRAQGLLLRYDNIKLMELPASPADAKP